MNALAFFPPLESCDEDFPQRAELNPACGATGTSQTACPDVGESLQERRIELERHIKRCNWLAQEAEGRWHSDGCFAAKGESDRWRLLRDSAIKQLEDLK